MPPIRMDIILYAQTGCAINSCTKINDEINFELNTQNFLPPIVTALFILQKRSIRLLTGSGYREHTNPLFYRAKCLKLKDIYSLETAKLMYKIHNMYYLLQIQISLT